MKPLLKKLLQNLLLLSVSMIFAIAVVEAGVRIAGTELHPPSMFISSKEDVPYKNRPNYHGSTTTGIPLDMNSMGMRDREYGLQKPGNTTRIVVLGDSTTFGQAVRQEDSYPEQIEAMYAAEGRAVEVINAGVSGYTTHEEMLFLNETAIKYDPDIVLVGYALNDLGMIPPAFRGSDIKSKALYSAKEFVKYRLYSYSYITRTVQALPYNIGLKNITITEKDYTPESAAWNTTYEAMEGISKIAADSNANLVVAILPELRFIDATAGNYKFAHVHELVAGQFKEINDAYVVDLLPAFGGKARPEVTVSITDAHPNREGHAIIASAIKQFLDEEGLVPK